jgi:hypothetical protein
MSITLSPGMSGVYLDLFVKAGPVLFNPASTPIFQIKDANSNVQGSGWYYASGVSTGHFDARGFIVPSSGTLGTWTVTWNAGGSTKIEQFTVAAATLDISGDSVNDIDRVIDNIRIDIGDFNGTIFSTSLIERYLVKSVMRLNRELGLAAGKVRPTGVTPGGLGTPMRMSSISIDFDSRTVTPDNDEIKDILILQAEVLITRAEFAALRRASAATAAADGAQIIAATSGIVTGSAVGIMIKNADGVTIDTKTSYTNWMNNKTKMFLEDAAAREKQLEKAIMNLKYNFSSTYGKVVY